jgi:flagellar basal-body rod protein FlgG
MSDGICSAQLANFVNPAGLLAIGRTSFVPTDASGQPVIGQPGQERIGELGTLALGFLAASNVEVVTEMVDLIATPTRVRDQGVITIADEMLQRVTQR